MADFYMNSTSQDESFNSTSCHNEDASFRVLYVVTCVTIAVSLPVTLAAVCAVFSLVQKDQVAPIYVINLLICDLLQLCSMIVQVIDAVPTGASDVFFYIYYTGLMATVDFMVCVALERYLVIAWPLWYHFGQPIRTSLIVCGVVWGLSLAISLLFYFCVDDLLIDTILVVYLLLPYPVLIFCLGGTIKALSAASRVPPEEKRRIVALSALVLLTYTLLFLPSIIWYLPYFTDYCSSVSYVSYAFLQFSPFADSFLYVLLRKGTVDKLLAFLRCCSLETTDVSTSTELTVQNT